MDKDDQPGKGSYSPFEEGLEYDASGRLVRNVKVHSKLGLLHTPDREYDCAYIERQVDMITLRYVVIGLTRLNSGNNIAHMRRLIRELDKCILSTNGIPVTREAESPFQIVDEHGQTSIVEPEVHERETDQEGEDTIAESVLDPYAELEEKFVDSKETLETLYTEEEDLDFDRKLSIASRKLNGKFIDFRGCKIGDKPDYLSTIRAFFTSTGGVPAGITASDWWIGFPGMEFHDRKLSSEADLIAASNSDAALFDRMEKWAVALFPFQWNEAPTKEEKIRAFFREFFTQNMTLPVYNVEYDPIVKETLTLYRSENVKAVERWLVSLWGRDLNRRGSQLRNQWNTSGNIHLFQRCHGC